MNDFATATDPTPSTIIDDAPAPAAGGGGAPSAPAPEPVDDKPISIRDSLEKAAKDVAEKPDPEADDAPKDEKPEVKPKAEEAAPKAEPKAEGAQEAEPKPSEGRKQVEAPARLLPKARELWRHVPHELRVELERLSKEDNEALTQHKEASERYTELREFDELARTNGTTLKEAVSRYHELESLVAENPIAAMNQILMQAGPRKPDGQPFSLWELASAIQNGGQDQYNQLVGMRQQQAAPQADPRVQQLEQENAQLKVQSLQSQVIEPFKAQHPRFDELSTHIAKFLQSDIVPKTLGPLDRLATAYDMAERLYPAANDAGSLSAAEPDRGSLSSGSKSIKSTPGSVSDDFGVGDRKVSIREAIEIAGKKQALRG